MIDQTRIQKIIKRLLKSPAATERQAVHPSREWAIGIFITLVGVGIGGAISYLTYLNTISVEVATDEAVVEPATYSGIIVEEAALRFRERAVRFAELRGEGSNNGALMPSETDVAATSTKTEVVIPTEAPAVSETPAEEVPVSESSDTTPQLSF